MYPSFAFIAHNPLFTIIAAIKVNLLTIQTEAFFLVLFQTGFTQIFYIILMRNVVLSWFVIRANLIATYIRRRLLLSYFTLALLGRRGSFCHFTGAVVYFSFYLFSN